MNEITLREAANADLPALVTVLKAAFEEYRDRLDPPSGAHGETAAKLREVLRTARAVLALAGDDMVGCVFYAPSGDHIDLFRLAVLPEYRRRGIAQALIAYVEARGRELGLARVQLGVRVALPNNRAYYERLGYRFVEARTHAGYAEPTFVILEKLLDERVSG
jgi:ribosomal protein S18 acetylase RimI-like enzyme